MTIANVMLFTFCLNSPFFLPEAFIVESIISIYSVLDSKISCGCLVPPGSPHCLCNQPSLSCSNLTSVDT